MVHPVRQSSVRVGVEARHPAEDELLRYRTQSFPFFLLTGEGDRRGDTQNTSTSFPLSFFCWGRAGEGSPAPPANWLAASVSVEARVSSAYVERALRSWVEDSAASYAAYVNWNVEYRVERDEAGVHALASDRVAASVLAAYYRANASEWSSAREVWSELRRRLRWAGVSAENSADSGANAYGLLSSES